MIRILGIDRGLSGALWGLTNVPALAAAEGKEAA